MPPIRRLLSCKLGRESDFKGRFDSLPVESDPYETMESIKVADLDGYLEAVLSKYKRSHGQSGINFLESPRSCKLWFILNWLLLKIQNNSDYYLIYSNIEEMVGSYLWLSNYLCVGLQKVCWTRQSRICKLRRGLRQSCCYCRHCWHEQSLGWWTNHWIPTYSLSLEKTHSHWT